MTVLTRTAAASRKLAVSADFTLNIIGGMNVNLRTAATNSGWNGTSRVVATVISNVGSNSTGLPALTIDGSFPSGVALIINPGVYVVGRGGNGQPQGGNISAGSGGPALSVSVPVSITNNGTIGGGGGAGGGCNYSGWSGGGGAGLVAGEAATDTPYTGPTLTDGGGGGNAGGAVGQRGQDYPNNGDNYGASGGGLGAAGGNCSGTFRTIADGPDVDNGYDVSYRSSQSVAGGQPGAAVLGNANVTWIQSGTTYGPLNS